MATPTTYRRAAIIAALSTIILAPAAAQAAPSITANYGFQATEGAFPLATTGPGFAVAPSAGIGAGDGRYRYCAPEGLAITRATAFHTRYHGRVDGSYVGVYFGTAENRNMQGLRDDQSTGRGWEMTGIWTGCIYFGVSSWQSHRTAYNRVWGVQAGEVTLTDTQGPAVSAPTVSAATTAGWIRPANQADAPPAQPVAAAAQPITLNVSWEQSDNAHFRGSTGLNVGGQNIDFGDLPNGTHTRQVTVTGPVAISAWRTGNGWATAGSAPATGGALRVDATPPSITAPAASYDPARDGVNVTWNATDGAAGVAFSEAQILVNGTWQRIEMVAGGRPTVAGTAVSGLPEGTYRVRIVARDVAGNWQTAFAPDVVISRPQPSAPSAGGQGETTPPARPSAAAGSNAPATRPSARKTRYSIMAEFSKGNTRRTTFAAARKGLFITGQLLDGYGDPVAGAKVRIQQNTQKKNPRVWTTTTNANGEFRIRVATRTRGVLGATSDNVIRPVRLYVNR